MPPGYGYGNRQRKGWDRDAGNKSNSNIPGKGGHNINSNMPGVKEAKYSKSGKSVPGTGRLPAAGGGYE